MSTARRDRPTTTSRVKLVFFTLVMLGVAGLLLLASSAPLFSFTPFESDVVNGMLNYQLSALPVVALALAATFVFARKTKLDFLRPRRIGEMRPFLGVSLGTRWEKDALPIALIMAAIVGVTTYFQLLPGGYTFNWVYLALVVPFAAANAFTEEAIFRLPYVTVGADLTNSRVYGLVMGALVFGVIHYWGVAPNGLIGAIMSAWLGFYLAKSIQETRGFFWAFTTHFLLNLVGMVFILNRSA